MAYPIWTYNLFYLAYARPRVPTISSKNNRSLPYGQLRLPIVSM